MSRDIDEAVDALADELRGLARALHDQPELAYEEHESVARIGELLQRHGAEVERPFGGLETAFRARLGDGGAPHVAIVAEYDALPEIGHACGHNLIAGGAVGAWLAILRAGRELAGTVDLIGTPAEEGGGGKIRLLEAGAFEGVDAAMMFHPFDRDLVMHDTLATARMDLSFLGVPSHAAIAPEEGRSALTACLDTLRLIDGQRITMGDGEMVHAIVTDGGQAVNIIPERTAAQVSLRAPRYDRLEPLREMVERCARGAAMASGVEVEVTLRQGYRNMRNNAALARRFGEHLAALGRSPRDRDPSVGTGSTDMGDVSHAVPAIHPWLGICDAGETTCHQRPFAECARSARGLDTMLVAAKTLARTTVDFIGDEALRRHTAESST